MLQITISLQLHNYVINPSTGSPILSHRWEVGVILTPRILWCILSVLSGALNANQLISLRRSASIIKPELATERRRLHASMMFICLSVCLPACRQNAKTRFFQIVSNLGLCFLLRTYRKSYMGFSKNLLLNP